MNSEKDFFAFWAKNNLLLYTQRATCPFDPPKMLFRGLFYSTSCPQNAPRDYPDISEPVKGRVKPESSSGSRPCAGQLQTTTR